MIRKLQRKSTLPALTHQLLIKLIPLFLKAFDYNPFTNWYRGFFCLATIQISWIEIRGSYLYLIHSVLKEEKSLFAQQIGINKII